MEKKIEEEKVDEEGWMSRKEKKKIIQIEMILVYVQKTDDKNKIDDSGKIV